MDEAGVTFRVEGTSDTGWVGGISLVEEGGVLLGLGFCVTFSYVRFVEFIV